MVLMLLEGMPDDAWLQALTEDIGENGDVKSKKIHRQVRSFLILSTDELVQRDLISLPTAKQVWDSARKRYGVASRLEISIYRSQFYGDLLNDGESIEEYVRTKRRLATICTDAGKEISDSDIVDAVLAGCRRAYESVVENLSATANLSLEYLVERLRDSEQARKLAAEVPAGEDRTVAAATAFSCSYCGKPGHVVSKCWKKVPCRRCKTPGHPFWRCPKSRKDTTDDRSQARDNDLTNALLSALKSFSNEPSSEYSSVSRFLSCLVTNLGQETIADSGSGKTLISRRKPFKTYETKTTPISMAAEGSIMYAEGQGEASLDTLGLPSRSSHALHTPALGSMNLLSVSFCYKIRSCRSPPSAMYTRGR
jgi:hypothetical protein